MNASSGREPQDRQWRRDELVSIYGAFIELDPVSAGDVAGGVVDKKQARHLVAERRLSLPALDHAGFCAGLGTFLATNVDRSKRVLIYDAMGDEVSLTALIEADPEPAKRFAVTRTPNEGYALSLHPWGGPSERHRYGYLQPAHDAPVVDDAEIGAVLVPALAFDVGGMRLGRGKGYYDRLLIRSGPDRLRIGMTAGLIADRVPRDSYDIAMTHLAAAGRVDPVDAT